MSGAKNILVRRTKLFVFMTVTSLMTVSYPRSCGYVITWKYFMCMVEQKHGWRSMIFHESMYHNMRIHVFFLPLYFLRYPNLIRHHTSDWVSLVYKKNVQEKHFKNQNLILTSVDWVYDKATHLEVSKTSR